MHEGGAAVADGDDTAVDDGAVGRSGTANLTTAAVDEPSPVETAVELTTDWTPIWRSTVTPVENDSFAPSATLPDHELVRL